MRHAVRQLVNGAYQLGRELGLGIDKTLRPKKAMGPELLWPRTAVHSTTSSSRNGNPPFPHRCGSLKPSDSPFDKMAEVNQDEDVKSQKRDRSEFEGEDGK